jgi:hypothetical protein
MSTPQEQNAGRCHSIKIGGKFFEVLVNSNIGINPQKIKTALMRKIREN